MFPDAKHSSRESHGQPPSENVGPNAAVQPTPAINTPPESACEITTITAQPLDAEPTAELQQDTLADAAVEAGGEVRPGAPDDANIGGGEARPIPTSLDEPVENPSVIEPQWGSPLTDADYASLEGSWISRDIADRAMLRRVNAQEGRQIVGQRGARDCAGVLFSNYFPGQTGPRSYRIRRDNPEYVQGKDGKPKPDRKYLGAPGQGNQVYIPPGITLAQLRELSIPIVIVEGEKKALALWRLANYKPTGRVF
jgi:hypothetical protein